MLHALLLVSLLGVVGQEPPSRAALIAASGPTLVKGNQAPSVTIIAPSNIEPGEMVKVSAEVDKANLPANLQILKYQWFIFKNGVLTDNYITFPDNTVLVFGAGMKAATYTVMLDVDCLYGVSKDADGKLLTVGGKQALVDADIESPPILSKVITVGTPAPPTPEPDIPGPTPIPPTPTPPAPTPNLTGFAKAVYDYVQKTGGFTQEEKYKISQSLGSNFDLMASKIAANVDDMKNVQTILKTTKTTNNEAIGQSGIDPTRLTGVKQVFGDWLYQIYGENQLNTPDAFMSVWRDIATGLKAVPKG